MNGLKATGINVPPRDLSYCAFSRCAIATAL
jgi:hypothetical protein